MNKDTIIAILFLSIGGLSFAQAPQFAWVKPIFGASPTAALESFITDLSTDRAGNTYLTGEFQNQINFGNITLNGNGDDATLFVAKYSPAGTPLWAKKATPEVPAGTSAFFSGSSKIDVDSLGNIYWCGNFIAASLDFGGGLTVTSHCSNGCQEGFFVKLNTDGDILFAKSLHASIGNPFSVTGVAVDAAGRHYLAGSFTGTELWLQGGANIGGITRDGFFTVQYAPAGNAEWVAFLPDNSGTPKSSTIAISPDGQRIVVAGSYTDPTLHFGNGASTSSTSNSKQFAVWYNTSGQPMGAGTLGAATIELYDMSVDNDYKLWAACDFTGNLTWNDAALTNTGGFNHGASVAVVAPSAAPFTTANIGYNGNSAPVTTLALDSDGRFFTGGYAKETLQASGGSLANNGCSDVILSGGSGTTVAWGKSIGGAGCEETGNFSYGSLMDTDQFGNLYVGGIFENGATAGGVTIAGNGLWIGKLNTGIVSTKEADQESVSISPNPAQDWVTINTSSYFSGTLQVYAVNGKLMMEQTVQSEMTQLDVSALYPGIYFVSLIKPGQKSKVNKLVVE